MVHIMLNCALYKVNAEKLSNLGALKDFVQIISNARDFRSLLVRCCIEAIWNVLENGGPGACRMMAFARLWNPSSHIDLSPCDSSNLPCHSRQGFSVDFLLLNQPGFRFGQFP